MCDNETLRRHYRLSSSGTWHRLLPGSATATACHAEVLDPIDPFVRALDRRTPGGIEALPVCKRCAAWAVKRAKP